MSLILLVAASAVVVSALTAAATLFVRARGFVTVAVEGMSMSPAFEHGDRVLVSRRSPVNVLPGQVVVVERPDPETGWTGLPQVGRKVSGHNWYIKRVAAVAGEPVPDIVASRQGLADGRLVGPGELVVLGDHFRSEDSKQWGCVPVQRVLGVVVRKVR